MLSVIIHDNGEQKVVEYTYELLFKELKDIAGAELIVSPNWFKSLKQVHNNYVCLVEADCLVSPGFFEKQVELMKKSLRKVSMYAPVVGVNKWTNCFYGYQIGGEYTASVIPITHKKSTAPYPVQIGYLPGAIIRAKMLQQAIEELGVSMSWNNDLVFLSTQLSLAFWRQGKDGIAKSVQNGNPVYVNPGVTYVTTEDYVNDIGRFEIDTIDLMSKFSRESI